MEAVRLGLAELNWVGEQGTLPLSSIWGLWVVDPRGPRGPVECMVPVAPLFITLYSCCGVVFTYPGLL